MKLKGKVAIVTGGGKGIGKAIAICFAREGADITVCSRTLSEIEEVSSEILKMGKRALARRVDVSISSQVNDLVSETIEKFGKIDILVNNAGWNTLAPIVDTTDENWDQIIKVHLYGSFYCSRAVSREMIKRKEGKILNIVSISGIRGSVRRGPYGVAKAGVINLTKIMAGELGKFGINVNAIAPGPILTDLILRNLGEEGLKSYINSLCLNRLGDIEDVAKAALFLCSSDSDFITGHTLPVDGGFVAAGRLEKD
jgi:NAD(P)-dependent dehydrogenase (short-subunit alcohol dehydrogenase family)